MSPKEVGDLSVYLAIIADKVKGSDDGDRYRGRYLLVLQTPKGETELNGRIKGCEAGH